MGTVGGTRPPPHGGGTAPPPPRGGGGPPPPPTGGGRARPLGPRSPYGGPWDDDLRSSAPAPPGAGEPRIAARFRSDGSDCIPPLGGSHRKDLRTYISEWTRGYPPP